ncbi:MAG: hypothetical protein ACOC32_02445 [Nanoarchaeota archaeon]
MDGTFYSSYSDIMSFSFRGRQNYERLHDAIEDHDFELERDGSIYTARPLSLQPADEYLFLHQPDAHRRREKFPKIGHINFCHFRGGSLDVFYAAAFQDKKAYELVFEDSMRKLQFRDGHFASIHLHLADPHDLDKEASRLVKICREFELR